MQKQTDTKITSCKDSIKGFTLAEVLLTLTIIGIVAAMAIPSLVNNVSNVDKVARLKKTYAVLQQAFTQLKSEGSLIGNSMLWEFSESKDGNLTSLFVSKLNATKTCLGKGGGCWYPSKIHTLNPMVSTGGRGIYSNNVDESNDAKAVLLDGTMLMFGSHGNNCTTSASNLGDGNPLDGKVCGYIWADVNGSSGPNTIGRDVFGFFITLSGIYPNGVSYNTNFPMTTHCDPTATDDRGLGFGCAAKVLQEGAMNY